MYDQLHVICLILDVLLSKLMLNSRIYIFFQHFQLEKPKEGYTLKDSGPDSPLPAMVSIVPLCLFLFFVCVVLNVVLLNDPRAVRYVSARNLSAYLIACCVGGTWRDALNVGETSSQSAAKITEAAHLPCLCHVKSDV